MNKKSVKRGLLPYLLLIFVILGVWYFVALGSGKVHDITYDKLLSELKEGNVTEVEITPHSSEGTYTITGKLKSYKEKESFYVKVPLTDSIISQMI